MLRSYVVMLRNYVVMLRSYEAREWASASTFLVEFAMIVYAVDGAWIGEENAEWNEWVSEWGGDELLKCTEGRTTKTTVTYDVTQAKSLVFQLYEIVL